MTLKTARRHGASPVEEYEATSFSLTQPRNDVSASVQRPSERAETTRDYPYLNKISNASIRRLHWETHRRSLSRCCLLAPLRYRSYGTDFIGASSTLLQQELLQPTVFPLLHTRAVLEAGRWSFRRAREGIMDVGLLHHRTSKEEYRRSDGALFLKLPHLPPAFSAHLASSPGLVDSSTRLAPASGPAPLATLAKMGPWVID